MEGEVRVRQFDTETDFIDVITHPNWTVRIFQNRATTAEQAQTGIEIKIGDSDPLRVGIRGDQQRTAYGRNADSAKVSAALAIIAQDREDIAQAIAELDERFTVGADEGEAAPTTETTLPNSFFLQEIISAPPKNYPEAAKAFNSLVRAFNAAAREVETVWINSGPNRWFTIHLGEGITIRTIRGETGVIMHFRTDGVPAQSSIQIYHEGVGTNDTPEAIPAAIQQLRGIELGTQGQQLEILMKTLYGLAHPENTDRISSRSLPRFPVAEGTPHPTYETAFNAAEAAIDRAVEINGQGGIAYEEEDGRYHIRLGETEIVISVSDDPRGIRLLVSPPGTHQQTPFGTIVFPITREPGTTPTYIKHINDGIAELHKVDATLATQIAAMHPELQVTSQLSAQTVSLGATELDLRAQQLSPDRVKILTKSFPSIPEYYLTQIPTEVAAQLPLMRFINHVFEGDESRREVHIHPAGITFQITNTKGDIVVTIAMDVATDQTTMTIYRKGNHEVYNVSLTGDLEQRELEKGRGNRDPITVAINQLRQIGAPLAANMLDSKALY